METYEKMYDDLRQAGVVHNKKELADKLGIQYSTLVAAMSGSRPSAVIHAKEVKFWSESTGSAPSPSAGPSMEELMNKALDNMHDAQQIAKRAQDATDRLIALLENHLGVTVMPGIGAGKKFEIEK